MIPSPVLNIAIQAVRKAGALAVRHFDNRHQLQVREKSPGDFVSNADTEVEKELVYQLKRANREYGFLLEEKGGRLAAEGWQWIIDPIDGTANFLRGIPHFALSVALALDGEVVSGVVYQPVLDELFFAERGRGAFLNNQRLRVNDPKELGQALLATGFPLRRRDRLEPYLKVFTTLLPECADLRRDGSAALDLAYTAAGRYDGYFELNLHPWDVAAGALLVREAGGFVTSVGGNENFLTTGDVVAASPRTHERLLAVMRECGLREAVPPPVARLVNAEGASLDETAPRRRLGVRRNEGASGARGEGERPARPARPRKPSGEGEGS
ncbi:MAG: inositol monophosphatase [Magnetococcales bacterium]|nr:inositol monophosphatase [Magnetococcales bacterium]